ncbi:hypothetical protein PLESTF_001499400 [Pleodorina starrii]|nr:hypothetical protein PLESTF_001499400 [Pleodorina starrii]
MAAVAPPPILGPAEAAATYLQSLVSTEEVISLALAPSTCKQQQAAGRETPPPSARPSAGRPRALADGRARRPLAGLGVLSPEVEGFRKRYTKGVASGGLVEVSAIPLHPPKFHSLVDYLWSVIRAARSRLEELLLLLRDLLCMLYMWARG